MSSDLLQKAFRVSGTCTCGFYVCLLWKPCLHGKSKFGSMGCSTLSFRVSCSSLRVSTQAVYGVVLERLQDAEEVCSLGLDEVDTSEKDMLQMAATGCGNGNV